MWDFKFSNIHFAHIFVIDLDERFNLLMQMAPAFRVMARYKN